MKSLRDHLGGAFVFLVYLFFFVPCAQAGEVTLAWDANAESDIAGYNLYVGVESRGYGDAIDVGNFTTCTLSGLEHGQTYYFAVTAYNQTNLESDFSNEVMTTLSAVNQPPLAEAGPDQNVGEGVLVALDGSNSTDPEGDPLSFSWSQVQGSPVVLADPSAARTTFHAPYVGTEGETLIFQLTVTDPGGLESSDTCMVNVLWVNEPPIADAGPDQEVWEGDLVTLDGSHSFDPDGFTLAYAWEQTGGTKVELSGFTVSQPAFWAPNVGPDGESLSFTLTVTDAGGLEATDHCVVNVVHTNQPPVADAGGDQSVEQGTSVTLDGSGSFDPDGTSLSYAWSQTQGAPVTLDSPKAKQTTFVAPEAGPYEEMLVFELTVTDSGGLQSSDQSAVLVMGADAGIDLTGEWLWIGRSFAGRSRNCFMEGTLLVENLGTQWADSSLLYVYESDDPEWDSRDAYLGSTTIPALEAGQSVDISFKFKTNSRTSPIYLIAVIDATCLLDDIDEENNIVPSWPVK